MSESGAGYAMANEAARESLVWFNSPLELLTWMHPVLELVLLAGAAFALIHACMHYRRTGDLAFVGVWTATVVHAVSWEIAVFSFDRLDMFWHGEFTVMLYGNRLPLYIVLGYYPAIFYHSVMLSRRLGYADGRMGRLAEALAAGLILEALYVPVDTISPVTQFWTWDHDHLSARPMWDNIPANSYLWGLGYGFSYAFLCRLLLLDPARRQRLSTRQMLLRGAGVGLLIPVLGMVFLGPVTILIEGFAADTAATALIFLVFLASAWCCLLSPRRVRSEPDRWLLAFPVLWLSFVVAMYLHLSGWLWPRQDHGFLALSTEPGNLLAAGIALAAGLVVTLGANCMGRAASHNSR